MRKAFFPCLLAALLTLAACDNEAPDNEPTPGPGQEMLNYDGPNADAPQLPGNTYEGAIRLPASRLAAYGGYELAEVYYYLKDQPSSCTVKVYLGTQNGSPDSLIYSAVTTSQAAADAWNRHTLSTPLALGGQDLWIAVKFFHGGTQATLGCDPGPAQADGDWLLDSADGQWRPLVERAPSISINWNIRAIIQPQ
jgi:hypothetical protein